MNRKGKESHKLFDVVVKRTVGSVYDGAYSGVSPYEAAFAIIAQDGSNGTFEFQMDELITRVTVEHEKDGDKEGVLVTPYDSDYLGQDEG